MIQIIDYGAGNLKSVSNALKTIGEKFEIVRAVSKLRTDAKVIFPGVGAAGFAIAQLREAGFADLIANLKQPFLGICLGMQLLMDQSEEDSCDCLGILNGSVQKFSGDLKVPQIGWNKVFLKAKDPLFDGVLDESYFYFVHSYFVSCESAIGESYYGEKFVSAVRKDNFWGLQFHPEKSGEIGLEVLNNFCKSC